MNILCFMLGFILCGFIVFLYNLRWVAAARRRRKREAEKDPTKKTQATKIIVFSIMITYYIAFAVAFYCWKRKAENLEKIKKGNPDLCGSLSDFSGMGSQ